MARGKGIFTDEVSDDIDDLLPSRLPEPNALVEEREEYEAPVNPVVATVAPTPTPTIPRRRVNVTSTPTVQVDPEVHKSLRRLTSRERGKNPTTARTYTQVVLDAIESHEPELSVHWQATGQPASGGLFTRQKVSPSRRRRHPEPPARVPLAGLSPTDLATLDKLVADWNAGSRSALVEEALRLYLN